MLNALFGLLLIAQTSGAYPELYPDAELLGSGGGTISAGSLHLADDIPLSGGNTAADPDFKLLWDTSGTHQLRIWLTDCDGVGTGCPLMRAEEGMQLLMIGDTAASADASDARVIISGADTSATELRRIGLFVEHEASGVQAGVGLSATARTGATGNAEAISARGVVSNTADTGWAMGLNALSYDTHAGGDNIAISAFAANGTNNWALYIADGNIRSIPALDWNLVNNNAAAIEFVTGIGGLAVASVNTTNGEETLEHRGKFAGITVPLDAATGDEAAWNLSYTTNKTTSGDDYGIRITQTDTASPGSSYLLSLETSATWQWYALNDGSTYQQGGLQVGGDFTTPNAIDWDLADDQAEALCHDAPGKAGILCIDTRDGVERVAMSGDLDVTGDISADEITLTEYTRTEAVEVGAAFTGVVAPNVQNIVDSAGLVMSRALGFDSSHGEYAIIQWPVPFDWVGTSDITLRIVWTNEDGDALVHTEDVDWYVDIRVLAIGEAMESAAATTYSGTYTQVGAGTDSELIQTEVILDYDDITNGISPGDEIFIQLSRNKGSTESNSYSGDASTMQWIFVFKSNTVPK